MDGSFVRSGLAPSTPVGAIGSRSALVAEHEWIPDEELPALRRHFLRRARYARRWDQPLFPGLLKIATDYGRVMRARRIP